MKNKVIGITSILATIMFMGIMTEAIFSSEPRTPQTAEEKIAASRAVDDRAREKNKEELSDVQARAELAWLMIDQADRNAICYAYSLDAVGTMDMARTTWRSQGHSEREVKALAGSVRKNC